MRWLAWRRRCIAVLWSVTIICTLLAPSALIASGSRPAPPGTDGASALGTQTTPPLHPRAGSLSASGALAGPLRRTPARSLASSIDNPFSTVWREAVKRLLFFVPTVEFGCTRAQDVFAPHTRLRPLIQMVCDELPLYVQETAREPVDVEESVQTVESTPVEPPAEADLTGGRRVALGVYVNDFVWTNASLDRFEQQVGQPMQIVQWYQPWGADRAVGDYQPDLDVEALHRVTGRGAVPMITWEPWGRVNGVETSPVRTITTGVFDDYIDGWANGLRSYGKPVFLRLFHEMNGDRYPWSYGVNGNSAEDLIDAWRYVHGRFQKAKATNVLWVWSPNVEDSRVSFQRLYPGSEYVDWFGVDGYNRGRHWWYSSWRSPRQLFQRSLDKIGALDTEKPIMIAEVSSVESGGDKAHWIRELYTSLAVDNPRLRAIIWFHYDMSADPNETDWRLDSSPEAVGAYKDATSTSLYSRRDTSAAQ